MSATRWNTLHACKPENVVNVRKRRLIVSTMWETSSSSLPVCYRRVIDLFVRGNTRWRTAQLCSLLTGYKLLFVIHNSILGLVYLDHLSKTRRKGKRGKRKDERERGRRQGRGRERTGEKQKLRFQYHTKHRTSVTVPLLNSLVVQVY
jgi:hypothetical protein